MRHLGWSAAVALTVLFSTPPTIAQGPLRTDPAEMNREWIAICDEYYAEQVAPLRDYRISQGRSACIWTFADLVMTYGSYRPEDIRQALQEAHATWTVRPRWVLLVGDHDASGAPGYDILSDWDLENPELGRWEPYIRGLWPYMDLDDDGVPELAVGRLPARWGSHITAYVTKVIAHDRDVLSGDAYDFAVTLLQDVDDSGNDGAWVRELGDSLHAYFNPYPNRQILRQSGLDCCYPVREQAAIEAWDSGPAMVLAMGTGSNWFQLVDFFNLCGMAGYWTIDKLAPTGRYPALLGLSCAINATDHVIASSCDARGTLAEKLLLERPDRGASVVIAPMRNTIQWWNFLLGKHLLLRKAAGDPTWGEVFRNAMRDALAEDPGAFDHVFQYVLEGDPAVQANRGGVLGVGPPAVATGLRTPSPNPAREAVELSYGLSGRTRVQLDVCDVAGRRIRRVVDRVEAAGSHAVSWNLRGDAGAAVPPGIYFARLRLSGRSVSQRIVVVK